MSTQKATISVHSRGFGFLEWTEGSQRRSAFVPAPELRGFLHLDEVEATVRRDKKGLAASDLRLLSRHRATLFGQVTRGRKGRLELTPDAEVANQPWRILGGDLELKEGMHVTADLRDDGVHVRAEVPPEEVELQRIRDRYLIRHPFAESVVRDAKKQKPRRGEGRRDLRELTTLTIDAPSSRDLDDALSVQPAGEDGAMRVFVHIADVDSLVAEGSPVDEEARARGTSVYLAGGVTPMLPRVLSEERLSLLPRTDRDVLTAELPPRRASMGRLAALAQHRMVAEMDAAMSGGAVLRPEDGGPWWTVVVRPAEGLPASPLDRWVTVVPLKDAAALLGRLRPLHGLLQNAALAVKEAIEADALREELALLGVSRMCPPGAMATPSMVWHHDGKACVGAFVRWADVESVAPGEVCPLLDRPPWSTRGEGT